MSNYWDLYCLDCESDGGWHWNYGDEQLAAIWRQADLLAPLARFDAADLEVRVGCPEHGGGMASVQWLAEHISHRVIVRSEYDYLASDCAKYVVQDFGTCLRRKGHDGECSVERDYDPCETGSPKGDWTPHSSKCAIWRRARRASGDPVRGEEDCLDPECLWAK